MLAAISVTAKKFKTSRSQSDGDSEMETYFSVYNRSRSSSSSSSNNTDSNNNDNNGDPDFKIPASFCVDWVSEKVLSCPRMKLASSAKVLECCPFGKELKYPLLSGCIPSDINQVWKIWANPGLFVVYFQSFLLVFKYGPTQATFSFFSTFQYSWEWDVQ